MCFLCGPCRGGYLEDNWDDQSSWLLLTVVDSLLTELKPGEYERSACENVKCELKVLFEVRDSVRLNTRKLREIE
jgi:hypothetical protein